MKEIITGQIISHYKIIDKLGSGGMGVVYKAEDTKLDRIVALKFLPPELTREEEAKQRFIREAKTASSLQDNNICTIHDIEETDDGQLFIVMDCYEGESLKDIISRETIKPGKVLEIIKQISNGLKKAHEKGIVHRDIKPANIFITNEGVVKILDFGLAKSSGRTQLTQMGSTVGTISYMSPEQASGVEVDQRTDIWALGIVMYEMLTGVLPFSAEYDQAIIYSILNDNPDFSKVPERLKQISQKALAKDKNDRYQKIEELISDLDALQNKTTGRDYLSFALTGRRKISLRTKIIAASIFVVVLALVAVYFIRMRGNTSDLISSTFKKKMIVVLPFENLGPPEDEYFAQGIRDEISNKLSTLSSIGVISRNSAERYAETKKSTKEIGKELGVDYILEGTIQWAKSKDKESRIKIIPQLVRVSDDINVWSDSYDRIINDIFAVQNEIAQNVVDKLGIKILPGQTVTGPPPTTNINAYDYYLKALPFHYGPTTGDNLKTCIKLYEKAIELDTNFAAAYAQVSIAYMGLFKWYWDRDSLNLKKSSIYLKKAKEINSNIAEVHLSQFFYYAWFTNDKEMAFQELKKVLELQPNNAEALLQISGYYQHKGNYALSKQCVERALQLDPLNARYPWADGLDYNESRDYKTADKYFKRAIELSPNSSFQYVDLAKNYLDWKGSTKLAWQTVKSIKDDEYLAYYENIFIYLDILDRNFIKALDQLKSSKKEYENSMLAYIPNSYLIALIYKYMRKGNISGRYFEASKIKIEKLLVKHPDDPRLHFALSRSYAGLDNLNKAVSEINKALDLSPFLIDPRRSYVHDRCLVDVYMLVGDYENALRQIDSLLSNPTGFSINILKLDPLYDPLRNLTGYKKIIEKYSN